MATMVVQEGAEAPRPSLRREELLNCIVDSIAQIRPQALYAEIPISTTRCNEGYRKISYSALANSINGVAWWWSSQVLGPGTNSETLRYIGPSDFRHNFLPLGAIKAGYEICSQCTSV